jgi:hypothetical protein
MKNDRELLIDFINYYLSGVTVNLKLLHLTPEESVDEFLKSREEERKICPECKCNTLVVSIEQDYCVAVGCHYRMVK